MAEKRSALPSVAPIETTQERVGGRVSRHKEYPRGFLVAISGLGLLMGACTSRDHSGAEPSLPSSAVGISPSGKTYPKARPEFLSLCGSRMSQADYKELLEVSDLSSFKDFREAAPRSKKAAEILGNAGDRRGIFASMYVAITQESVGSSDRGEYNDNKKAGELVKRFADRYFEPLHNYLLNGSEEFAGRDGKGGKGKKDLYPVVDEWKEYYKLSEDCGASDLRILGTGVNCHMTYDLPYALSEISAPESFRDDFMEFGEILIKKKSESTSLLKSQQMVNATAFFDLFFIGKIIDGFMPKGTAATWGFQLIRAEAWRNGLALQEKGREKSVGSGISEAWSARQTVLLVMPKSNSKMKGTEE